MTAPCCCTAPSANAVLALAAVEQYGRDSFGDADYIRLYGLRPGEWYERGIRLIGRTAGECMRDAPYLRAAAALSRTIGAAAPGGSGFR